MISTSSTHMPKSFTDNVLASYIEILQLAQFKTDFPEIKNVKTANVLKWIAASNAEVCKRVCNMMREKNERRRIKTFRSMFRKNETKELRELGTEQNKQIFKASAALVQYNEKDPLILQAFWSVFDCGPISSLLVGTRYVPQRCSVYRVNKSSQFSVKVPRRFEVLVYLHALKFFCMNRKRCEEFAIKTSVGNRIGYVVQTMSRAWSSLAKKLGMESCEEMVSPYIVFHLSTGQFQILKERTEGFAPLRQRSRYDLNDVAETEQGNVCPVAWMRNPEEDAAFRFLSCLLFEHLHEVITTEELYTSGENEKWEVLEKYKHEKGKVARVFHSLPSDILNALRHDEPSNHEEHPPKPRRSNDGNVSDGAGAVHHEGNPAKRRRRNNGNASDGDNVVKLKNEVSNKDDNGTYDAVQEKKNLSQHMVEMMKPYYRIHDVCFRDLIDVDAEETGSYLDEKVQLIATDPPYNTRKGRKRDNSSHDTFSAEDMADAVTLFDRVLKPGGHGIVFCSSVQFASWHALLRSHMNEEDDSSNSDHSKGKKGKPVFTVEDIPLFFVRSPGHYFQNPGVMRRHHLSVVEQAVHFWKNGVSLKEERKSLDYRNQGFVPSRHAAWTNCIDEVSRLDEGEKVFLPKEEGGTSRLARPEQKKLSLIQEIISRYTKPGDIVLDMFAGTLPTAKACLLLPKHRRFVGCDSDPECVKISLPTLLDVYAEQVLNKNSTIPGTPEDVRFASELVSKIRQRLEMEQKTRMNKDVWNAPEGLPLYQRMPIHIHRFVASLSGDRSLVEMHRSSPPQRWQANSFAFLNTIPIEVLVSVEATAKGCLLSKSSIRHPSAGKGVYSMRQIVKGEEVLTYYGTLIYDNLSLQEASTKSYGEGILSVRKKRFSERAIELQSHAVDQSGKKYSVFIVLAAFCLASYINDPRYLPEDEEWEHREDEGKRIANVIFSETKDIKIGKNKLCSNRLVTIQAVRQIEIGEELFVDYGKSFAHWEPCEEP